MITSLLFYFFQGILAYQVFDVTIFDARGLVFCKWVEPPIYLAIGLGLVEFRVLQLMLKWH